MAYAIYTTKALVCGTYNNNTADRSYLLFTRELGMLYAAARSVREERSKQRYSLQDFSLIRVSLVKGKTGWRIGSVAAEVNYFAEAIEKESRGSVVKLFRLLRRFYSGEEPHAELFDYVVASLFLLTKPLQHRSFVEQVVESKVLLELGYVDKKLVPEIVLELEPTKIESAYSADIAQKLTKLSEIAVSTSHL